MAIISRQRSHLFFDLYQVVRYKGTRHIKGRLFAGLMFKRHGQFARESFTLQHLFWAFKNETKQLLSILSSCFQGHDEPESRQRQRSGAEIEITMAENVHHLTLRPTNAGENEGY